MIADPNSTWDEKAVAAILGAAALPDAVVEGVGRAILNTYYDASATGQLLARANFQGDASDATIDRLNAVVYGTTAFNSVGSVVAPMAPMLDAAMSATANSAGNAFLSATNIVAPLDSGAVALDGYGGNPALSTIGVMRDGAGNAIPVAQTNDTFMFQRTNDIGITGTNLEAASGDLVQQEPGYLASFDSKVPNGNGFDLSYATMVDGEPQLTVVEDKSGATTSPLTAFGEGARGAAQLDKNVDNLVESIQNSELSEEAQTSLIQQAIGNNFSVELHVSDTSAIPQSRLDFLNSLGLTPSRIVVIPGAQ